MNKEENEYGINIYGDLMIMNNKKENVEIIEVPSIKKLFNEYQNLKQALNEIREIINDSEEFGYVKSVTKNVQKDILQIIDEVLGDDNN